MIDELWPPNPNELDNATLMSSLSFFEPTSKFVSWFNVLAVSDNLLIYNETDS